MRTENVLIFFVQDFRRVLTAWQGGYGRRKSPFGEELSLCGHPGHPSLGKVSHKGCWALRIVAYATINPDTQVWRFRGGQGGHFLVISLQWALSSAHTYAHTSMPDIVHNLAPNSVIANAHT